MSRSRRRMKSFVRIVNKTLLKVVFRYSFHHVSDVFFPAKLTAQYCLYLPDHLVDTFRMAAKTHHIRVAPIFFPDGSLVQPDEWAIRLDNVLLEVMFTLKHYLYGSANKAGNSKYKYNKNWTSDQAETNTFTATIVQVKIIEANTIVPSPVGQPTMKSVEKTPSPEKGKQVQCQKRATPASAIEDSPSRQKKSRVQGILLLGK